MHQSKTPAGTGVGQGKRKICENFRAIVADMSDEKQWYVARIRCKMWICESCAEINKAKWRAHLIDKINVIGTFECWWFITVTAHAKAHKARSQIATVRNLQRGLKTLYDRLRRIIKKGSGKLEYVRVYEPHKTHKIHAHFIVRATFTAASGELDKKGNDKGMTRWLKDNSVGLGMGYQCSAKPIKSSQGAHAGFICAYVTKYLTKSIQGILSFPKGMRRIQCSSGFGCLDEKESQFTWTIKQGIFPYEVVDRFVTDLNTQENVTLDDFENHHVYPHELTNM